MSSGPVQSEMGLVQQDDEMKQMMEIMQVVKISLIFWYYLMNSDIYL